MPFVLSVLFSVLFSGLATAATYRNPYLGVTINVPAAWQVRPHSDEMLRIVPPRQEDRERGGVQVQVSRQPLRGKDPLSRLAARYRRADDTREPAQVVRLDRQRGRLVLSYREGLYVQSGLWIVSQQLVVWQQQGDGRYIKAHCSANAAEYARYRRVFADICLGLAVTKKTEAGA